MATGVRSGVFTGVPWRDNYDGWSGRDRARAVEGKEGERGRGGRERARKCLEIKENVIRRGFLTSLLIRKAELLQGHTFRGTQKI